jgi:hypothetical protein
LKSSWTIRLILPPLLIGALAAAVASGPRASVSSRQEETCIAGESPTFLIHLRNRLVVSSSDSVFADGALLARGDEYWLDYAAGTVYFTRGIPKGTPVRVVYSVFPLVLRPDYRLRVMKEGRTARSRPVETVPRRAGDEKAYDIRASGSKTISIEAGSFKDAGVSQSLNLSIGGRIGENVEVRGVLSDRDVSLGKQASTASLKDLDRIFMEVRSSGAFARVGDLEVEETPGELLSFKRDVTGFFTSASHGSKTLAASGATSRSRYESVEITGREGISGPYRLPHVEGMPADVVNNSEKVWLDGRPMKRGVNADYTIDYDAGEVFFNPRHMIREGARIVVDYQSPESGGDRQLYFGSSSLGLGSRSTVALSLLGESYTAGREDMMGADSEDSPLLGASGDGWVDGGKHVGPGNGDYLKVETDSVSYYEFVGTGAGDYDVTFTWVGEGAGSYSYLYSEGHGAYIYLHTGSGEYVARIRETPRVGSRVIHLRAASRPTDWLDIVAEGARSRGHLREEGGWNEREDHAYAVTARSESELPRLMGSETGALEVSLRRRSIGESYVGFDRLRSPDALEVWGQDPGGGMELTNQVGLAYRLSDLVRAAADLGSMYTGEGRSRRRAFDLRIGSRRLGVSAGSHTAWMTTGTVRKGIDRNSISARFPVGFLDLGAGRDYETRERLGDSTSVRRTDYYSTLSVSGDAGKVMLRLAQGDEERDLGAGWNGYATSVEGRVEFETRPGRKMVLRGSAARRQIEYQGESAPGIQRLSSGDLHLAVRDLSLVSSLALDYRLANALTSVFETKLIRVDGVGDYDSLGNYVPGAGSYVMSRYEKGREPVTRVRANMVLELGRKGRLLLDRTLSSRTAVDVEGESASDDLSRLALLSPSFILTDRSVAFGRINLSEEIVMRPSGSLTVSLNARGSRQTDSRCVGRREELESGELGAKVLSSAFEGMTIDLSGRVGSTRRSIVAQGNAANPTQKTWNTELNLQRSILKGLRGTLRMGLLDDRRTDPASSFLEASLAPGLAILAGGLRCDSRISVKHMLRAEFAGSSVPRRDSVDWSSRLMLRHGPYASVSLEYTGRTSEGIPTIHNLRASLSATF